MAIISNVIQKNSSASCSKLGQNGLAITVESVVTFSLGRYTNITLKYAAYSFHSARLSFCFLLALGCGEPPEVYDSWNMTVLSGTSTGNEITFSCVEAGMGPLLRNASITNNTHNWEESPITTLIIITEDCKSINFITSSLIMRQRCIHYYCHYSLMNLSLIQSNYQWVPSPLHYPLSLLNHRKVPFPLLSHY